MIELLAAKVQLAVGSIQTRRTVIALEEELAIAVSTLGCIIVIVEDNLHIIVHRPLLLRIVKAWLCHSFRNSDLVTEGTSLHHTGCNVAFSFESRMPLSRRPADLVATFRSKRLGLARTLVFLQEAAAIIEKEVEKLKMDPAMHFLRSQKGSDLMPTGLHLLLSPTCCYWRGPQRS